MILRTLLPPARSFLFAIRTTRILPPPGPLSLLLSGRPFHSTMPTDNTTVEVTTSTFTSRQEERRWNRISEAMASFHEYFKQEFNTIYELADGSFSTRGLSLPLYLRTARDMNRHLTMHHTIEERHIFPILAKRMPQFSNAPEGEHIHSHKGIHDGIDSLTVLIAKWTEDPKTYSPVEMKACLDGFRDVLFHHLDEEVADLRGENLKKYFALEEIESILM